MKNIIKCDSAPAALGPYSHACEANGFICTSGQLGIDPATGKLAEGVEAQAHQALVNIDNVLKTAGATMKDILKTTIFLVDLNDFAAVNRIYGDYFGSEFPGRSCFQVSKLPAGGLVEIEVVAYKG